MQEGDVFIPLAKLRGGYTPLGVQHSTPHSRGCQKPLQLIDLYLILPYFPELEEFKGYNI